MVNYATLLTRVSRQFPSTITKGRPMNRSVRLLAAAVFAAAVCSPAVAGEISGNDKDLPIAGASICQFSGQNDDPTGIDPDTNGPPGRTQSFGQDVANWGADPTQFNPGDICSPTILPWKPIGRDQHDD